MDIGRWFAFVVLLSLAACSTPRVADWRAQVADTLPRFGHRNWIAIVDSAYPEQASESIETVVTGAHQLDVVRAVLAELDSQKHVAPTIYLDRELAFVAEKDAPGIVEYRNELARTLAGHKVNRDLLHGAIILSLEQAGASFDVLVLKTDLALPYTSVFVELGCGYWNDESEARLRAALGAKP
jgi:L-fucose mutarotase/ribose pyranase (RbsD/FucU family)